MSYKALSAHLHSTANAVSDYFKSMGVSSIRVEHEVDASVGFSPTLSGRMTDFHILAVEVTDSGYTDTIDAFVLDCQELGLPVKLHLVFPNVDGLSQDFATILQKARRRGIAIIVVDESKSDIRVYNDPVSLSLTGLRKIDHRRFPTKYRQAVVSAQQTFLNGAKGLGV